MKVIRKLKLIGLIVLFVNCKGNTQGTIDKDAINKFEEQLSVIEESANSENIDSEKLDYAVASLEKITNIHSYIEESDYEGDVKIPVSFNIQDWNSWLKQNKKVLKLDKEKGILYTEGNVSNVIRNPSELFSQYIGDLKEMSRKKHYVVHEIYYIIDRLERLTKYRGVKFSEECSCRFPTEENFTEFDNWYQANKSKLNWNSENQKIEINN